MIGWPSRKTSSLRDEMYGDPGREHRQGGGTFFSRKIIGGKEFFRLKKG